jgi:hypothetical protein
MLSEKVLLHTCQHIDSTYERSQTTENIILGTHIMRAQIHSPKNHSHQKNRKEKRTRSQITFMAPQYQELVRYPRC